MDFEFNEQEQAFRRELHSYLESKVPAWYHGYYSLLEEEYERTWDFISSFTKELSRKRWLIRAWPEEYGGQQASYMEQLILAEEMKYHYDPRGAYQMGVNWVGPAVMRFGGVEQKRQHLAPIAHAEAIWCQGFSEPDAGSDLASLQTRAVVEGDYFVINGRKIWTSWAELADWCVLAVRTDPTAPKHKGISLLLLDMKKTPGITVRLIPAMFGLHFCEVLLENVRVPRSNLVGEVNHGWQLLMAAMDLERSGYLFYPACQRELERLVKWARAPGNQGDLLRQRPELRNKLAEMAIKIEVAKVGARRLYWAQQQGVLRNYEASAVKVLNGEVYRSFVQVFMELAGSYGELMPDSPRALFEGLPTRMHLWAPVTGVSSGTTEVQKYIIATQGLGLPRA